MIIPVVTSSLPLNTTLYPTDLNDTNAANHSITDSSNLAQLDREFASAISDLEAALSVLTFLMCFFVNCFLIYSSPDSNALRSKKNVLLTALLCSAGFAFAANSFRTGSFTYANQMASSVGIAIMQIVYLSYSWIRSRDIFAIESNRITFAIFYGINIFAQIACIGPVVSMALTIQGENKLVGWLTTNLVGALVVVLDCYSAYSCGRHYFRKTIEVLESHGSSAKGARYFPIVAVHQLCASCGTLLMIALYAGETVLNLKRGVSVDDMHTFYICSAFFNLAMFMVMVSLASMKVRLITVFID
ncbi:hypothetical protein BJ741DRAFT_135206 [Chytriomyces cf. hyalinus JEL632]|nr:hypothetical protein BJ741DRAFT_135206 [Chytriomyces cf. hyalinus JEL632]